MNSINDPDLICRSCMTTIYTTKFDLLKTPQIAELYIRLSTANFDEDDPLPKSLCQSCYQLLKDFEKFQTMCLQSYRALLLVKMPVKTDFKEEYIDTLVKTEEYEISERLVASNMELSDDYNSNRQTDNDDESNCDPLENIHCTMKDEINEKSSEDTEDKIAIKEPPDSDDELLSEIAKKTKEKTTAKKKTSITPQHKNCDSKKTQRKSKRKPSSNKFSCEICSKRFFKEYKYEAHVRQHAGLKPYACKLCPKGYARKSRLLEHVYHNHSDNPVTYPCTFEGCEKVFSNKEGFRIHMKNMHVSGRNPVSKSECPGFICELCGKVLSTKASLRKHTMIHTNEYPFACDTCPKKYRTQDKLRIHKLKHQGIKRFECQICGLKKTTGHELNVHMMIHTKPKILKCEQCTSSFRVPSDLLRHVKIVHVGVRNHKCKYCDQRFGRSDHLKRHEMRHTGERRYECSDCGQKFIQCTSYRNHVRRHHKTKDVGGVKNETVSENFDNSFN